MFRARPPVRAACRSHGPVNGACETVIRPRRGRAHPGRRQVSMPVGRMLQRHGRRPHRTRDNGQAAYAPGAQQGEHPGDGSIGCQDSAAAARHHFRCRGGQRGERGIRASASGKSSAHPPHGSRPAGRRRGETPQAGQRAGRQRPEGRIQARVHERPEWRGRLPTVPWLRSRIPHATARFPQSSLWARRQVASMFC